MLVQCTVCNDDVKKPPNRVRPENFCKKPECQKIMLSRPRGTRKDKGIVKTAVDVECNGCGTGFVKPRWAIREFNFCDHDCFKKNGAANIAQHLVDIGVRLGRPKTADQLETPDGEKSILVDKDGYKWLLWPEHPNSHSFGRVGWHIYAIADLLGRPLEPGENVHHINGDKGDNRVDGPLVNFRSGNLELWSTHQPKGQRVEDKVAYAKEILALYEPHSLLST